MLAHFANNATAFSAIHFIDDLKGAAYWLAPTLGLLWIVATFVIVRMTASEEFQSKVQPSPLSRVPAGVPPMVAWGCGIPGVLSGLALNAGIAALGFLITTVSVDDDVLAPKVNSGDQLLVMKTNSPILKVESDQVVVFKRGTETLARTVSRVQGDEVWVFDAEGGEEKLNKTDNIIGSMIQVFPSSKEE